MFCLSVALFPFGVLALATLATYSLGCDANFGPGANHCRHASDGVASGLVGLMWFGGFGWLLTAPLGIVMALGGTLFKWFSDRPKT
jgi:hypothetical protein